jgi:hypothetical protein
MLAAMPAIGGDVPLNSDAIFGRHLGLLFLWSARASEFRIATATAGPDAGASLRYAPVQLFQGEAVTFGNQRIAKIAVSPGSQHLLPEGLV